MNMRSVSLTVSPAIGAVSGEYIIPSAARAVMTLAHGAGAGMQHWFMAGLAGALAEVGIATLRFNFPFAEKGKGRPDQPAVAHETIAAAIGHARSVLPELPLFAAGKSFGGRMTSQYLAAYERGDVGVAAYARGDVRGVAAYVRGDVRGVVFYGFPLHPPGKPSVERAEHLKGITAPMLFLQGTRDELARWDLIYAVCSSLRKTRLVRLDGVDHGFKAGKKDVIGVVARATVEWVDRAI